MKQLIDRIFLRDAILRARDDWDESKHKRAENGQFTSGGGSGGSQSKEEQIASLKEQMKKYPLFGAGSEKRKEIREQIKALEGSTQQAKPEQKQAPKAANKVQAEEKGFPVTEQKQKQFELIQKTNPMSDDYHVGIRKPSDIRSPEEAFNPSDDSGYLYPDFTRADGERALKTGRITVYSSKPIKSGGFVSPSQRMASDYAGGGKVYKAEVPVGAVAWINADEGQFAQV